MDHPVVITFLILAIIGFLYSASAVFKPLALAILLSFALTPIARFLENRGVPRVPAVILTVFLALMAIGAMTYQVGVELNSLAGSVDQYEDNIIKKIQRLQPGQASAIEKVKTTIADVSSALTPGPVKPGTKSSEEDKVDDAEANKARVQKVEMVKEHDFFADTESQLAPYLEGLETGFIVLILLLFLMLNRENMTDRITQLFGQGRISLTTRTTQEVGERISKYLITFASMNTAMGFIIGTGCYFIGIPYAVLWGFLAGALRFIPYAGPATAFALPLLFSIASFESWREPMLLVALYAVIEVAANMALEPIIYGKTTGVSSLALLVAAMFWSWLWGPIGLLLSTPLTVSLAVLGKYVPSLRFFATFLREDIELDPSVRYYQKMLAGDQDGATEVIDEVLKKKPRVDVFDQVIIPSLSLAERDHARDEIGEQELAFVHQNTDRILDDLADEPEINLSTLSTDANVTPAGPGAVTPPAGKSIRVLALPAHDETDALVLQMLALLLKSSNVSFTAGEFAAPVQAVEQVKAANPELVLISHLPPDGLTATRHLTRRIRAQFPKLPIIVGRWDHDSVGENVKKSLTEAGASQTFNSLKETREFLVSGAKSDVANQPKVPAHASA